MRTIHVISMALAGLVIAGPALALDEEALMEQLKSMQAQMDRLQKEVGTLKHELSATKERAEKAESKARMASIKMAEHSAKAQAKKETDVKVTLGPGPKFETVDGNYSFKIGGFAQIDAAHFQDDWRDYPDGTRFRRARINVSGNITKDFNYKIENDFANNASAITDAYLEFTGFNPIRIQLGQFKEPFGMETLTSDLFTSFVERASVFAFSPDRNIGLMVSTRDTASAIGAWTISVGGFGSGSGTNSVNDEAKDLTGRVTWAPIAEPDKVLHLGVAGSYRVPDSNTDVMRFLSTPDTALANNPSGTATNLAVDTGSISQVDNVQLLGLEAAGVWGPASVQGEYVQASVNRRAGAEPTYSGYYVEASYFLTGESRNYSADQGRFDRVKPKNPLSLSQGDWGAWQVMARVTNLDLNDAGINGGQMNTASAGIKWYMTANTAILLNYIKIKSDNLAVTPNDEPSIWVLRTQFDF